MFFTYGLARSVAWARSHGVLKELLLLSNLGLVARDRRILGTLLGHLADADKHSLLESWSIQCVAAEPLWALSNALHQYGPPPGIEHLPDDQPAKKALRGDLKSTYIAAALATSTPQKTRAESIWWAKLCCWLLVHATDRAIHGIIQDTHLRTVATAMYRIHEPGRWRTFLMELEVLSEDFLTINGHIENTAIALRRDYAPLSSTEDGFFRAIIAAAGFSRLEDAGSAVTELVPSQLLTSHAPDETESDDEKFVAIESVANLIDADPPDRLLSGDEDGVLVQDVREDLPMSEKVRVGRSVLLLTAEQRQFLPWSWTTPNRWDRSRIDDWIAATIESPDSKSALLAAITWIAMTAGRSINQVCRIVVDGSQISDDWTLNVGKGQLQRQPPRRYSSWVPDTPDQREWLRPLATAQTITLPSAIIHCLAQHIRQNVRTIGDIWQAIAVEEVCATAFRQAIETIAPRVTGGMLAHALTQFTFEASDDTSFARLLGSSPNSGLPAPCAYARWTSDQLPTPFGISEGQSAANIIAMGSRLDPLDGLLAEAFSQAKQTLDGLRSSSSILEFHNAFVSYWAVGLLAATGCRPVRDIFESPCHFDLENSFLYVDDKDSDELHQGRLIPLPSALASDFMTEYGRHLKILADTLYEVTPDLSFEIRALIDQQPTGRLPFLFLLSQTGSRIQWASVSAKIMTADDGLFHWPLPANLFRHRLAQRLRELGLNAEIIDGMLGHAEEHAASYGDRSFRCWADDAKRARPMLAHVFSELGFSSASTWAVPPPRLVVEGAPGEFQSRPFGIDSRARDRQKRRIAAWRQAQADITRFLNSRPLDELSPDEILKLSKSLLFGWSANPTDIGKLKYAYLIRLLSREDKKSVAPIRLNRLFLQHAQEASPFGSLATESLKRCEQAQTIAKDRNGFVSSKNTRRHSQAMAAALLLCIEHRWTDVKLLCDVATLTNIHLVIAGGIPYLEHFESGQTAGPTTPVRRIPLSERAAHLLAKCGSTPLKREILDLKIDTLMQPLAQAMIGQPADQTTSRQLIKNLAALREQTNFIELEGIRAGYLSGRVLSYSPSWADLYYVHHGQRPRLPTQADQGTNNIVDESFGIEGLTSQSIKVTESHPASRQTAARLLKAVRDKLIETQKLGATPEKKVKGTARQRKAIAIDRLIKNHENGAKSAVTLLVRWIAALLRDDRRKVKIESIDRYRNSLSSAFENLGYHIDLTNLDDDELTDFYASVLEHGKARDRAYVAARLFDFHHWVRSAGYGIAEPNWSELPDVRGGIGVLPGMIGEREYQDALLLVYSSIKYPEDVREAACWLLICAHRAGLRRKESWGLLRQDWMVHPELTVVVVKGNRHRSLKTLGSRRLMPLLFQLSELEQKIIDKLLEQNLALHGRADASPVLSDASRNLPSLEAASTLCNLALQHVTGQAKIRLHHLRHAYANRLFLAAIPQTLPQAKQLYWAGDNREGILSTLMANPACRRRTSWALGRALGHMGSQTTFRSYIHLLGDWVALAGKQPAKAFSASDAFLDLDSIPAYKPPDLTILESIRRDPAPMTAKAALKVMRRLADGREPVMIARALNLSEEATMMLCRAVDQIGTRLVVRTPAKAGQDFPQSRTFLRHVTESGWARLFGIQLPELLDATPGKSTLLSFTEMIGRTRQWVMWKPSHGQLAKGIINCLNLSNERFVVLASSTATDEMISACRDVGFQPISIRVARTLAAPRRAQDPTKIKKEAKHPPPLRTDNKVQIDAIYTPEGSRVERKVALKFSEDGSVEIRNADELLIMGIVIAAAMDCQLS